MSTGLRRREANKEGSSFASLTSDAKRILPTKGNQPRTPHAPHFWFVDQQKSPQNLTLDMDSLPPELKLQLLLDTSLTDLSSLIALSTTNHAFYTLFRDNESRLLRRFKSAFVSSAVETTNRMLASLPSWKATPESYCTCCPRTSLTCEQENSTDRFTRLKLPWESPAWRTKPLSIPDLRAAISTHAKVLFIDQCVYFHSNRNADSPRLHFNVEYAVREFEQRRMRTCDVYHRLIASSPLFSTQDSGINPLLALDKFAIEFPWPKGEFTPAHASSRSNFHMNRMIEAGLSYDGKQIAMEVLREISKPRKWKLQWGARKRGGLGFQWGLSFNETAGLEDMARYCKTGGVMDTLKVYLEVLTEERGRWVWPEERYGRNEEAEHDRWDEPGMEEAVSISEL